MLDHDALMLSDVPPYVDGSSPEHLVVPPDVPTREGFKTAMGAAVGAAVGSSLGPIGASAFAAAGASVARRWTRQHGRR